MKRRKIFSLVLAGVMLFSNITSFAAETTETAEVSSTEIATESVTTEEISVDEAETTTIEISDETASIDETTETSEVTTEEDEDTTGFVKFSVSYDTLLSDVSFSVYDSNEEQVAVYIVSDAKVSFIDLLVDKDILYEQDEETLLSLENGDYYLSMDETVYDGDSTPSDAGIVYDNSKVEFTVNSEELSNPLEVEVSLEELVIEETEEDNETEEVSEASSDETEDSSEVATPSDISSDTEEIIYVTAASETENAVSSEGIVIASGTFGSLTSVQTATPSDAEKMELSSTSEAEENTAVTETETETDAESTEDTEETETVIATTSDADEDNDVEENVTYIMASTSSVSLLSTASLFDVVYNGPTTNESTAVVCPVCGVTSHYYYYNGSYFFCGYHHKATPLKIKNMADALSSNVNGTISGSTYYLSSPSSTTYIYAVNAALTAGNYGESGFSAKAYTTCLNRIGYPNEHTVSAIESAGIDYKTAGIYSINNVTNYGASQSVAESHVELDDSTSDLTEQGLTYLGELTYTKSDNSTGTADGYYVTEKAYQVTEDSLVPTDFGVESYEVLVGVSDSKNGDYTWYTYGWENKLVIEEGDYIKIAVKSSAVSSEQSVTFNGEYYASVQYYQFNSVSLSTGTATETSDINKALQDALGGTLGAFSQGQNASDLQYYFYISNSYFQTLYRSKVYQGSITLSTEEVETGYLRVLKTSDLASASEDDGCAGAVFTIKDTNNKTVATATVSSYYIKDSSTYYYGVTKSGWNVTTYGESIGAAVYESDNSLTNSSGNTATEYYLELPVEYTDYTVTETTIPDGYLAKNEEQTAKIKLQTVTKITASNIPQYSLSLLKDYDDEDLNTDINSLVNYSKAGATYDVYIVSSSSSTSTSNKVCTFETNSSGVGLVVDGSYNTSRYEVSSDKKTITDKTGSYLKYEGYLYIVETYASDGCLESNAWHDQIITSPKYTIEISDEEDVYSDELIINLNKLDAETGTSTAQGDASLSGAQFTIKYYNVDPDKYTTVSSLSGVSAARTWVLETDENGYINFGKDGYLVSGSYYYNSDGAVVIPLGVITIQETKAPTGYTLDNKTITDTSGNNLSDEDGIILGAITQDLIDSGKNVGIFVAGNYLDELSLAVYEDVIRGGFAIEKVDYDLNENYAQGDAENLKATYEVYNRSATSVYVDGETYKVNDVVLTFTTDGTGYYLSDPELLPYGTYEIVEIEAPEGYLIDETRGVYTQTFSIREDGDYYVFGDDGLVDEVKTVYAERIKEGSINLIQKEAFSDPVMRGGFYIEKRDEETGDNVALGSANLKTKYQVINRSTHAG